MSPARVFSPSSPYNHSPRRIPVLLFRRGRLLAVHDLLRRPAVRTHVSARVSLHLLACRFRLGHGDQGPRCRGQAYLVGEQPVWTPRDVRLRPPRRGLHSRADELLQQGARHLFHERVRISSPLPRDSTLTRTF